MGKGFLLGVKPTSSFLILLLFSSLIFSLISLTFNATEVPTPIFVLSCFASFLFFVIVPTGKLLVDLGNESDWQLWLRFEIVLSNRFSIPTKNTNKQKIARALRTNNSFLGESYHASPRDPPSLAGQHQSHISQIENGLTGVYIYSPLTSGLRS